MHVPSDKLFERCPKCGAWPMAAIDVETTRSSGTVVFRCGRCREGLTRRYVAEPSATRNDTRAAGAVARS